MNIIIKTETDNRKVNGGRIMIEYELLSKINDLLIELQKETAWKEKTVSKERLKERIELNETIEIVGKILTQMKSRRRNE